MKISIHQPMYIPWIGYFNKIISSDKFVILDDVEFSKNDWFNRNKIKSANGEIWLTIPVSYKNHSNELIRDIQINNSTNWRKKHLQSIVQNYTKADFFSEFRELLDLLYQKEWKYLIDINVEILNQIKSLLGIQIDFIFSSELGIKEKSSERLVEICKRLNADSYLSGAGAKNYILPEVFEKNGIKLFFQEFNHPQYKQLYGAFFSHLSIIDLLMNCGSKKSIELIKNIENNKV